MLKEFIPRISLLQQITVMLFYPLNRKYAVGKALARIAASVADSEDVGKLIYTSTAYAEVLHATVTP